MNNKVVGLIISGIVGYEVYKKLRHENKKKLAKKVYAYEKDNKFKVKDVDNLADAVEAVQAFAYVGGVKLPERFRVDFSQ